MNVDYEMKWMCIEAQILWEMLEFILRFLTFDCRLWYLGKPEHILTRHSDLFWNFRYYIGEAGEYSAKLLNLVLLLSRRKILKQYFCAFSVFFPHPCSVSLFPLSSCAFLFSPASVFQTCWSINSLFTISKMHLNIWIWWMSPKAVNLLHEPPCWTEARGLCGLLLVWQVHHSVAMLFTSKLEGPVKHMISLPLMAPHWIAEIEMWAAFTCA